MKKDYEINFQENVWNEDIKNTQAKDLHGKRTYTKSVAEMQQYVTALDRYDDFRSLKIDPSAYEISEDGSSGGYGIALDESIHDNGQVVLDHQLTAARRFLSELRGFGLLADVVGSGKTYEAGIVLSELAVREHLKSLLIVAPGQVMDNWIDVLENKFGMGAGSLYQVRAEGYDFDDDLPPELQLRSVLNAVKCRKEDKYYIPLRPIIVDVTIFARWELKLPIVFDAIVVDEAHHLSEEEGEFAKAMKLLSELMKLNRPSSNSSYCLLLSATPHAGNLEKMFRLWYFIRCKGGNPKDFEEKDDVKRTSDYLKEKAYYRDTICSGATNVSDFIRRAKLDEFREGRDLRDELEKWMLLKGESGFANMSDYAKAHIIDDFLRNSGAKIDGEDVQKVLHSRVASAYHNRIMRSIMIRQPNHLSQKKKIRNVLYYPMKNPITVLKLDYNGDSLTLDFGKLNEVNMPRVTVVNRHNGIEEKDLYAYVKSKSEDMGIGAAQVYRELVNKILAQLGKASDKEGVFTKKGDCVVRFYTDVVSHLNNDTWDTLAIVPVKYTGDKLGYKYDYLADVLRKNADKRIVVFFDYELPKKQRVCDEVQTKLLSENDFAGRLIVSDTDTRARIIEKFNQKQDAILLVKNADFTEGANLQLSNIIVNYQVTPDPLAMDQRIGRIFRLGQKYKVFIHSLANINELEGFALGYFSGIGLMTSNSGDATILAGSNSDNMVAIRCKECGASSIEIMPKVEYEEKKQKDPDKLICYHRMKQNVSSKPCEKVEISVRDFKCDKCGHTLMRISDDKTQIDNEGYQCSSSNDTGEKGKLCLYIGSGKNVNKRKIYCSKLCAMSHCSMFKTPALKDCLVLRAYRESPDISEAQLEMICDNCNNTKCPTKCHYGVTPESVEGCRKCPESMCSPTPYVLDFDEKWEAKCPNEKCSRGKMKPVVPSTFALYIKELWKFEYDGGKNFCDNLRKEMEHVAEIKEILTLDEENKG